MSLNNRILLASPCYEKVDPEILVDWARFAYHCGRRMPEYDFFLGIKTKSEQFRARNAIVEAAQQQNCDRILMIDDDMIVDAFDKGKDAYDFLKKMIGHDKDICGILYYQRGGECQPVLMKAINDRDYRFMYDDEIEHKLQKVDIAGGGCLLIKTKVFDRIPFPYFAPEHEYGTDIQLCRQAASKGFEIWADTSIEFGHLLNEKTLVTGINKDELRRDPSERVMKRSFVNQEMFSSLIRDAMEYTDIESLDAFWHEANAFIDLTKPDGISDYDWYRKHSKTRVCRQVYYNTQNDVKKKITQFILSSINGNHKLRILDFGCGIGVTALALAEKGHNVTAMDIRGTGTTEFLKWRNEKYKAGITFLESDGGVPNLHGEGYDVIIATDCLEHIKDWKGALAALADKLRPEGMLFSNNAILDDAEHHEHYELHPEDFVKACTDCGLMPFNQVSYLKKEKRNA
jgi:hypothetical protein